MRQDKVAAFFDIDGTLVPGPSLEWRLVARLARNFELRPLAMGHWLRVFLSEGFSALWHNDIMPFRLAAVDQNKHYLAGVSESAVEKWAASQLANLPAHGFFCEALARIAWHRERGHKIFLISGTLAPLARAIAMRLACGGETTAAATELKSCDGVLSGNVAGETVCGPAKARVMARLAARHAIDLTRSYAYGNSSMDRWMLSATGHAVAVNPYTSLVRLARNCGWSIARWKPVDDCLQNIAGETLDLEDKLLWR